MEEWEANLPPKPIIQPKGNSITQAYYTEHLLQIYCDAITHARQVHGHTFLLVEDGDPSHGTRKRGKAQRKREAYDISNLIHPPHSPDLNPSEAAWNIWKQRMRATRGAIHMDISQLIEVGQKVWKGITMKELRERIKEMPERCRLLRNNGGKRIKGGKW